MGERIGGNMELFVVGKINRENYLEWEFMGVFDEREKAEEHCLDDRYFVGPCKLNEFTGEKKQDWPQSYYPKRGKTWDSLNKDILAS
jgi:hypothetical protein